MPRYYFSTANGDVQEDRDGTDLSDLAAARLEAIRVIGQVLKEHPDRLWVGNELILTVTNEDGLDLFQIVTLAIEGAVARNR